MQPSSLLETSATDDRRGSATDSASAEAASTLSGVVLPHHRPVVDARSGLSCGHELVLPSGLRGPARSDESCSLEAFQLDFALRRDWVRAAQLAGLTAHDNWLLLPVNVALLAQHTGALAEQLDQTLAGMAGQGIGAVRVVIEFDAAQNSGQGARTQALIGEFRSRGFAIGIKGFGDGFDTRLDLIDARPDVLRLSPALTQGVGEHRQRRSVLSALVGIAAELGMELLADAVDSAQLSETLLALGVPLQLGAAHGALAPLALR